MESEVGLGLVIGRSRSLLLVGFVTVKHPVGQLESPWVCFLFNLYKAF